MAVEIKELEQFFRDTEPRAEVVPMNPADLIFENRVRMNCFYCGKYNTNWRCPPNLPDIDYPAMMREFDHGMFVLVRLPIRDNFAAVRTESSVVLHKLLLDAEKWLWNRDCPTAISFIGGSCKLCKNGCGKERCNNPYMSRSPLEATGVNVVKSAAKYGIEIHFPPTEVLTRAGLLLW